MLSWRPCVRTPAHVPRNVGIGPGEVVNFVNLAGFLCELL